MNEKSHHANYQNVSKSNAHQTKARNVNPHYILVTFEKLIPISGFWWSVCDKTRHIFGIYTKILIKLDCDCFIEICELIKPAQEVIDKNHTVK